MSKYGKRIVLYVCIHCIKLEESRSHHFPCIHSCFPFVKNTLNFFIHSVNRLVLKKTKGVAIFSKKNNNKKLKSEILDGKKKFISKNNFLCYNQEFKVGNFN